MKEKFQDKLLSGAIKINLGEKGIWKASKADILQKIVSVCEDYLQQGYTLTLRQLYYQLVAKDWIPNHDKVYKKISVLKDDLVYSGLVDWAVFEDRNRVPYLVGFDYDIPSALDYAARAYRLNRQIGQKNHIEVWTEKDAISGVLKPICIKYGIRLVVNKGYTSSTAIYSSYCRFIEQLQEGKKIKVLYFGDHDPSGLDMIRDISERISFMFNNGDQKHDLIDLGESWAESEEGSIFFDQQYSNLTFQESDFFYMCDGEPCFDFMKAYFFNHFEVIPIGLTMEQIEEYNPPPNPAKITDPRAKSYVKEFGKISWEVDALSPALMERIVEQAIQDNINMNQYLAIRAKEDNESNQIKNLIKNI